MNIKSMAALIALAGTALGLAVASFMLWAAWQHNPQGEFHSAETGVAWASCLALFFCWFTLIAGLPLLIALGRLISHSIRRKNAAPEKAA